MSVHRWIDKEVECTYEMEYYSATEKDEILALAAAWRDLEDILLNERSWLQKPMYCVLSFIWNVQKRQIHRNRKQISGFQEPRTSGGEMKRGETAGGHQVSFQDDENILKLIMVMAV